MKLNQLFERSVTNSSNVRAGRDISLAEFSGRQQVVTDQQLVTETVSQINSYLEHGFPTREPELSKLKDTLALRALYLEDSTTQQDLREQLTNNKPADVFLDGISKKLTTTGLTEIDLTKLELLNSQIRSHDQIAVEYLLKNFDRESPGKLVAVIKNHQKFIELWNAEPSNLSIDNEFQLVNARTTLHKIYSGEGFSEKEVNRRIGIIYQSANELSSMQISVKEILHFLSPNTSLSFPNNFTVDEKFKFIESLHDLCQQKPPPQGLSVYLKHIFHSHKDVSGNMQEAIVAAKLLKAGWTINAMSQTVYNPHTELDLIATNDNQKFVIEVKTSSKTLAHKNNQTYDNQITNLLHHTDLRKVKLGVYCVKQAVTGLDKVAEVLTNTIQSAEQLDKVYIVSSSGNVFDLAGKKVA